VIPPDAVLPDPHQWFVSGKFPLTPTAARYCPVPAMLATAVFGLAPGDPPGDGRYRIVVDLEKCEYLDSTALGVIIGGLKRVRVHDGAQSISRARPTGFARSSR